MKHFAPPIAVDLLAEAVERARGDLHRTIPLKQRCRNFWSAVKAARNLGASDVVESDFAQLAAETGLTADLGRHAGETIEHLARWALLKRNPFE
jgi:hypothetical protein